VQFLSGFSTFCREVVWDTVLLFQLKCNLSHATARKSDRSLFHVQAMVNEVCFYFSKKYRVFFRKAFTSPPVHCSIYLSGASHGTRWVFAALR
jgi:hypothetical protein